MVTREESIKKYNRSITPEKRREKYLKNRNHILEYGKAHRLTEAGILTQRRARLKKYGLTIEQYDQMLVAQNYVCAICKKPESRKDIKYLAVDHDHKCCSSTKSCCGKCVRGLLCHNCNHTLAWLENEWGDKARAYLGIVV